MVVMLLVTVHCCEGPEIDRKRSGATLHTRQNYIAAGMSEHGLGYGENVRYRFSNFEIVHGTRSAKTK
jgi:hypothetical protein